MTPKNPRQSWLKALVAKYADGDLQAFAERVDIDRSTVSLLFHGHRPVTDKYAIRISNRLHIPPPEDMQLQSVATPSTTATPSSDPEKMTTREERMLGIIERLTVTNEGLASDVKLLRQRLEEVYGMLQQRFPEGIESAKSQAR